MHSSLVHTSIIPDAKFQQLNMSFTFDPDQIIINAHVDHSIYQSQFVHHLSFEDVKKLLQQKIFKIESQSPSKLQLKVKNRILDFYNGPKPLESILQPQIEQLSTKLLQTSQQNNLLRQLTTQLKTDIDLITTKITDLAMKFNQTQQQNISKQQLTKSTTKISQFQSELKQNKSFIETQKQQIIKLRDKINSQTTQINILKTQNRIVKQQIQTVKTEIDQLKNPFHAHSHIISSFEPKKTSSYKFSQTHKNQLIQLSQKNLKAQCNFLAGFALVNANVAKQGSSIRFKIEKLTYGLDVGLAIRKIIADNAYDIKNAKKIGHGCFLLENDGSEFSHSIEFRNNVGTNYKFNEGDVIEVTVKNEQELMFTNESKKWVYTAKIILTEKEWTEACFCVYLAKGNSVQII